MLRWVMMVGSASWESTTPFASVEEYQQASGLSVNNLGISGLKCSLEGNLKRIQSSVQIVC